MKQGEKQGGMEVFRGEREESVGGRERESNQSVPLSLQMQAESQLKTTLLKALRITAISYLCLKVPNSS